MKTWKEIKKGDTIYYYDHGNVHEQKVTDVGTFSSIDTFEYGNEKTKAVSLKLGIKAGKNSEISLRQYWFDKSIFKDKYFNRFTCKEALSEYLSYRVNRIKEKAKESKRMYEKYLSIEIQYRKALKSLN